MRLTRALLICLLLMVPGVSYPEDPPAGPKIAFEAETVQLGQVVRGESVEAEFVYRNEGDAPLRILRAKPG